MIAGPRQRLTCPLPSPVHWSRDLTDRQLAGSDVQKTAQPDEALHRRAGMSFATHHDVDRCHRTPDSTLRHRAAQKFGTSAKYYMRRFLAAVGRGTTTAVARRTRGPS